MWVTTNWRETVIIRHFCDNLSATYAEKQIVVQCSTRIASRKRRNTLILWDGCLSSYTFLFCLSQSLQTLWLIILNLAFGLLLWHLLQNRSLTCSKASSLSGFLAFLYISWHLLQVKDRPVEWIYLWQIQKLTWRPSRYCTSFPPQFWILFSF